ncbi:hypothetical protein HN385_01020 [archaeon]|jgi:hypothetical protein|nr:hypothetical protein [archaeon]MBT3450610.1 hypothetical protein [archaeon]MBT6868704.1 hypothetical protein [archaeon]MBT7193492.1 hypothetical protein [archaeon]MBT7381083.1 hypothetical protein [archaeon]
MVDELDYRTNLELIALAHSLYERDRKLEELMGAKPEHKSGFLISEIQKVSDKYHELARARMMPSLQEIGDVLARNNVVLESRAFKMHIEGVLNEYCGELIKVLEPDVKDKKLEVRDKKSTSMNDYVMAIYEINNHQSWFKRNTERELISLSYYTTPNPYCRWGNRLKMDVIVHDNITFAKVENQIKVLNGELADRKYVVSVEDIHFRGVDVNSPNKRKGYGSFNKKRF